MFIAATSFPTDLEASLILSSLSLVWRFRQLLLSIMEMSPDRLVLLENEIFCTDRVDALLDVARVNNQRY